MPCNVHSNKNNGGQPCPSNIANIQGLANNSYIYSTNVSRLREILLQEERRRNIYISSFPNDVNTGKIAYYHQIYNLRAEINKLENSAGYCLCNCNNFSCLCDVNIGTVCSCNCNNMGCSVNIWSCNWHSDKNLKYDIIYLKKD